MRRTTTLAVLLAGATLVVPTGPANAAGETCRGEAATIVGTETTTHGTEGRDVIVTGASVQVYAGGGDDLVCVSVSGYRSNVLTIDAGAGADVVDTTAVPENFYVTTILGDGPDTFVGGISNDSVAAGVAAPSPFTGAPGESEPDVIDTGAGSDTVTSGASGLTNDDVVRTGDGEDAITWSGTMGPDGVLDGGGDDRDTLIVPATGETFGVALAAQTLTRNGVREASFTSFEDFLVAPEAGLGSLDIRGAAGPDVVAVVSAALMTVDLGQGDDRLSLTQLRAGSNTIDLGAGTDILATRSREDSVEIDLSEGTMAVDGTVAQLDGVENAWASAHRVTLIGDGHANSLNAVGCLATIDGGGDDDRLGHSNYDSESDYGYDCDKGRATLRGGSGDDEINGGKRADRIWGGSGDDNITTGPATSGTNKAWGGRGDDTLDGGSAKDVLVGGSGRDRLKGDKQRDVLAGGAGKDRAVGGPGRDRCNAEREKSCER